ncbi:hypothetical protein DYU11_31150 [Fibrisoma montanum]|uniref:Uncharacterized protein n=1 Tax=Fibrisoma montanum TaxID=2305895 RepID=A0A418LWU8_9BACT|nr:hypothetical protein [Fibrisoma montanum]RIV17701.1 hypothetical protein DYU11_31150 [Fibrisoma montanum]
MKTTAEMIGLRFVGEGINPKNLTVKELAKLSSSLEDTILSIVQEEHPDVNKDEVYISLVDVVDASAGYKYVPSLAEVMIGAYLTMTTLINNRNFDKLSPQSIASLQPIVDFTNQRQCKAQLRLGNNLLATVEPSNRIKDSELEEVGSRYIYGKTTIYATVQRVGGIKKPKAMLTIPQSETALYIETTQEEAKKLAGRLYSTVALAGTAMYESDGFRMVNFKIDEILDYEEVSIKEAFNEVSEVIGKYWDNIEDIDEFLYHEKSVDE